jgi:hypothetical protein
MPTKQDLTKYEWFQYDEGAAERVFDQPRHNEEYELELHPGNVYGVKKVGRAYFVVHKHSPDIQFRLNDAEITMIKDKSAGWSGKIRRQTVNAGVGGKDLPAESLPKGWFQIDLDSSNLRTAIYNPKEKTLYITFHNGASWAYEKVTKKEFDEMEAAESRGRYFIYRIRDVKPQYKLGDNFDRPPYDTTPLSPTAQPKGKAAPAAKPPKETVTTGDVITRVSGGKAPPVKKPKPSTFKMPADMMVNGRAKVIITHEAYPGKSTTKTWSGVGFEWLGAKNPELGRILGELYTKGTSQVNDGKGLATITLDGNILIPKQ